MKKNKAELKYVSFLTLSALFLLLAGCGQAEAPAEQTAQEPAAADAGESAAAQESQPAPVLLGLDPVLLVDGQEVEGDDQYSVTEGDYRYVFTSSENKALFEANPQKYRIEGDGSCPVAPSATADPNIFLVHEGRIYTLATEGCIDAFLAEPELYAVQDDA